MNPNWDRSNLYAWEVPTFDLVERSPEERAAMLVRVGIPRYAYLSRGDQYGKEKEINLSQLDVDREIEAMQNEGVEIVAWYFWVNQYDAATDPVVGPTLQSFQAHGITPQLWLPQSYGDEHAEAEEDMHLDPDAQRERVLRETDRVESFVALATEAGCQVNLYNHQGWYGQVDNQLQILAELESRGIRDVGLVYNFTHSRGMYHDDQPNFRAIWARIKDRVRALNIHLIDHKSLTPDMLRIVDESDWRGPVGVIGMGDTEIGLANAISSLEVVLARIETERAR